MNPVSNLMTNAEIPPVLTKTLIGHFRVPQIDP